MHHAVIVSLDLAGDAEVGRNLGRHHVVGNRSLPKERVREKESVSEKERVELGIMWLPTPLCPTQKQPAQGNKIDDMVKRHWPSKRHSEEKERRKRGQREERTGVKEMSTPVEAPTGR